MMSRFTKVEIDSTSKAKVTYKDIKAQKQNFLSS